jgi:nitroimidazol reductase NimA-like FMN-containing flavoprotein (pyridoxamine 5'-phosphate oxidase superfamily)
VRRKPERGVDDDLTVYAILDEALFCHVGFVVDGQPYVMPTIHARVDDLLYLHGSKGSRMLRHLRSGGELCLTATLLDGLVLARSALHHSMNYRSAVVLGRAHEVTDRAEKRVALRAVIEHVVPGRWEDTRQPSDKELDATFVLSLALREASGKVRTGPPVDDEADYGLSVWAGELPLMLAPQEPVPDARMPADLPLPEYVRRYER